MNLLKYKDQWEMLGDPTATSIMTEGFKLKFKSIPELSFQPHHSLALSQDTIVKLKEFIPQWIKRGIIREILEPTLLYFSRIFMRPKKNGKLRPIIDLSLLNLLLEFPSFKMETVSAIAQSISGELWACSADIQDAYFHVPMGWEFHKFLAFKVGNRIFVFQYLPFGLSPAPWAFTRVIKPVKMKLRLWCIQIFSYLDDFIMFATSVELLRSQTKTVLDLLQSLGFTINWEKSSLTPAQEVEFLGVLWDLKMGTLSVPQDKKVQIAARCTELTSMSVATRRQLEGLVGLLNFAAPYIQQGRMRLLPIIAWMNLKTLSERRDTPVNLSERFKSLCKVWTYQGFLSQCVPLHEPVHQISLMTDASQDGWCGVLLPHRTVDTWPPEWFRHSMNWKELKAIHLSLLKFEPLLMGRTVRVLSDNTTALSCLRRQGTLRSASLNVLTSTILEFCREKGITLIPRHLQGVMNVLADQGSRLKPVATEWMLDQKTFASILAKFPGLQVDLFATRFNNRLPTFVSPYPDEDAAGCDAFRR